MSGSHRALVSLGEPVDTIVIDPDPTNNNEAQAPHPDPPDVERSIEVGVPERDFNIHHSVLYTHNYYEKVQPEPGADFRAKCLSCWIEKKKEVLLRITDGNIRGPVGHLSSHHKSHFEKYTKQRTEIDDLREKAKKKPSSSEKNTQMKLFSGGGEGNKIMQLQTRDDPVAQALYDRARVLFSAKTLTPFNALQHDYLYVEALLPKTHKKIKIKSAKTISRHTGDLADEIKRDIMSIILSVLEEGDTFYVSTASPQTCTRLATCIPSSL